MNPMLRYTLKIQLYIFGWVLAAGCGNNKPVTASSANADSILFPYAPVYTYSFQPGSQALCNDVLHVWKEFETGDVRHLRSYFADTLTLVFPDAFLQGGRDSILEHFQKRRKQYVDVQCYVDAWLPVHVPERNDDIVYLWGRQDATAANGKRIYRVLHEIWRFDKSGKIKRMEQYWTHPY